MRSKPKAQSSTPAPRTSKQTAAQAKIALRTYADLEAAKFLVGFFKTRPGDYAEGDKFIGVKVPQTRKIAAEFRTLGLGEIEKLLTSPIHEERLLALIILTEQMRKASPDDERKIFEFYVDHFGSVNNWDLVDTSAPHIVGRYLLSRNRRLLYRLAKSKDLWERRIAIVSTQHFIRNGEFQDTVKIAHLLLGDQHDLIHKATGWMLREVGNRDLETLRGFLDLHAAKMPRTMLRYAIEKLSPGERARYMKAKV